VRVLTFEKVSPYLAVIGDILAILRVYLCGRKGYHDITNVYLLCEPEGGPNEGLYSAQGKFI
jgi:hypothetical protein